MEIELKIKIDSESSHFKDAIAFFNLLSESKGVEKKAAVLDPTPIEVSADPAEAVGLPSYGEIEKLKVYELKAKFPEIRAKSKDAFIDKLVDAGLIEPPTVSEQAEEEQAEEEQAEEEQAEEEQDEPSYDDVRLALSQKVKDHKDVIRPELIRLGANKVSELDPVYYQTFIDFLNKLHD